MASPPYFLITIDTEGDNLWSKPRDITTRNSDFLPRFQSLCERYGFKPTYLTNFEMVQCPRFRPFAHDIISRGSGEIGMHLHAWNSPPIQPLTSDDHRYHPFLIEYPRELIKAKVTYLTRLLEDTFGIPMTSHRAGRWAFNETYAQILAEAGYQVDCSVTPHVSWARMPGAPGLAGGTDYTGFPDRPYIMDLNDISRPGSSSLIEVPMTILKEAWFGLDKLRSLFSEGSVPRRALNRFFPPSIWLRPNGKNLRHMLRILRHAKQAGHDSVEFMLHSSELMPAGSPKFSDEQGIDALYNDMERLFSVGSQTFRGATLTEYCQIWRSGKGQPERSGTAAVARG